MKIIQSSIALLFMISPNLFASSHSHSHDSDHNHYSNEEIIELAMSAGL